MVTVVLIPGYDQEGNPVDYIDENGTLWVYDGKDGENGNHWSGIPRED